jgi:hypothetical protein
MKSKVKKRLKGGSVESFKLPNGKNKSILNFRVTA